MNTNNLKRFAKDARIKLLDQVGRKLEYVLTHDTSELRGRQKEIAELKSKVEQVGKEQLIETVSYTWFNRLMALRFMDANGYSIPKVVTPLPGMTNPEILQNALGGNLEPDLKLDRQRVNDLLDGKTASSDAHTEAYKLLLVASCNYWHTAMPFMFERISDYTELLLPDDLLSDYSLVTDIRNGMSDEDCQQEELIGWLYQFYIADKKDDVFEGLKKNIKITAENIPAATQLFTPRWIVRYMVENTLGKLWLTFKPNSKLRKHMPYYIEAPEGSTPSPMPEGINGVTDITFLDPCQGSGHILVYAFDLFTKIYEEEGYNTNEIPSLILENNLFGIDIDQRAAQLAAFALTMKARSYYSRFLRKPVQPHVIALRNCNFTKREIDRISIPALCEEFENMLTVVQPQHTPYLENELYHLARKEKKELPFNVRALLFNELNNLINPSTIAALLDNEDADVAFGFEEIFEKGMLRNWLFTKVKFLRSALHAQFNEYNKLDNFGSLVLPRQANLNLFTKGLEFMPTNDPLFSQPYCEKINSALFQAEYLSRKFHCVVTNPPYLSNGGMNNDLRQFVEQFFHRSKIDLMSSFMERCLSFNTNDGKVAMINQHSWMFLGSYELLRIHLIENYYFENLLHLGPRTFPEIGGEVVQNTAFVIGNTKKSKAGIFIRLVEFENTLLKESKTKEAIQNNSVKWRYISNQNDFFKIPSSPFAYWASEQIFKAFELVKIKELWPARRGLQTGNTGKFIRYWHEVKYNNIYTKQSIPIESDFINYKWYLLNSGGGYRKWYGNIENVANWKENGKDIREFGKAIIPNENLYFKKAITWSKVSNRTNFRLQPTGVLPGDAGPCLYIENDEDNFFYSLGLLNSKVVEILCEILNPTLGMQSGTISSIPIKIEIDKNLIKIVKNNINIAKEDWDKLETSYDFKTNDLIQQSKKHRLLDALSEIQNYWKNKFSELRENEEYLNEIFIKLYNLEEDVSSVVAFEDVTILKDQIEFSNGELDFDENISLINLISYSIGVCFGRFCIDKSGFILANQGETLQDFLNQIPNPSFMPDEDNIVPVLDGEWFNDDIVGRCKAFLKAAFGEEHFEENLKYIEDTIGKDIRKYFVKDFYNDHIKRYKKRPIYWMFSSPKGHFKALIYMHRYQPDLCSKMLNDYLQNFIGKIEAKKQSETRLSLREDVSAREKTAAIKEVDKLDSMLKDCQAYEKTLYSIATQKITIDLDDGVKVNYQKFKDVLIPIKGLEKEED